MNKIESYQQFQSLLTQIRAKRKGFVTNIYWDANRHTRWLEDGSFLFEECEDCFILYHDNETFGNLYFIATDFDALKNAIGHCRFEHDVVVDVVCRGDGSNERELFRQLGFDDYKHLYRMSHIGPMATKDWMKDGSVEQATISDVPLVATAFKNDFDPLCEQIPSLDEIYGFIHRGQLFVVKDDDVLCGFIIYELNGRSWYLRYWYTSPAYREKGVGSKLLRTSLVDGVDTTRQMFWVIADNENAIKRYTHYGFKREDMNDYIMIKRP